MGPLFVSFFVCLLWWGGQGARIERQDRTQLEVRQNDMASTLTEDHMVEMLRTSTRALFGMTESEDAEDTGADMTVPEGTEDKGSDMSEPEHSRPEVAYDEDWFDEKCSLGDDTITGLAFYNSEENDWHGFRKCETPWEGGVKEQAFADKSMTKEMCLQKCQAIADDEKSGSTYCCEFDADNHKCTVAKGFLAMMKSTEGSGIRKLFSDKKIAKFVKGKVGTKDLVGQEEKMEHELEDVDQSKETIKKLVEQVNHMSIDGILRHLLSFYICMRWVPDDQFVRYMQHEMQHVDVDQQTLRTGQDVSEETVFKAYVDFDAVPLKCSSGMSVQDTQFIDALLENLKKPTSDIREAYEYSSSVAKLTWSKFWGDVKWSGSVKKTQERMQVKAEVSEMIRKAHTQLPWDQAIRPSQRYRWLFGLKQHETHNSAPDNLFFICFGPRVSSFPHKRENSGHFIADANMAGCNGLWSLEKLKGHIERIRQMFDPQTCLTENMRRRLKHVFLETFVELNEKFESKMLGKLFNQREGMETIPAELLPQQEPIIDAKLENQGSMYVKSKYKRTGRLVSGAHTKWLVCKAKNPASNAEGFASMFFNTPQAYKKWFDGNIAEQNLPECKTYDPYTGCQKCVFEVNTFPYRCSHRLGLTEDQVMKAVKMPMPPLASPYQAWKAVNGTVKVETKMGVCILKKEFNNHNDPRLEDQHKYQTISSTDRVYQIEPTSEGVTLKERYTLQQRLEIPESKRTERGTPLNKEDGVKISVLERSREGKEVLLRKGKFATDMTYGEQIEEENNIPKHTIEYFYSCPCEADDWEKVSDYQRYSTRRVQDYWAN